MAGARLRAPWDSLSAEEQRLFARMAEVYAGFVSYTDDQIGRLIDYLEESEQLDNTIIVVVSDNGASGEGGPNGSVNENKFFNGVPDSMEDNLAQLDELGSPSTYNHYPSGWAWAFDTPFPYWKRFAGYEGGTADICIVSWPEGITARGENRDQYVHAVDVVPTLYDLLDIEPPATIKGYPQTPLEGESFHAALSDCRGRRPSDAVLLDARYAGDLQRRLVGEHASSAHLRVEQLREGRVGAVPPRRGSRPVAQCRP